MIDEPASWFEKEWVVGWCGLLVATLGGAIAFFLSRKSARLDREKLELEISRLRNDPSVVAERREIYERLRRALHSIIEHADAGYEEIGVLHGVIHDATFRFPDGIAAELRSLMDSVIRLHLTNMELKRSIAQGGAPDHSDICERSWPFAGFRPLRVA